MTANEENNSVSIFQALNEHEKKVNSFPISKSVVIYIYFPQKRNYFNISVKFIKYQHFVTLADGEDGIFSNNDKRRMRLIDSVFNNGYISTGKLRKIKVKVPSIIKL